MILAVGLGMLICFAIRRSKLVALAMASAAEMPGGMVWPADLENCPLATVGDAGRRAVLDRAILPVRRRVAQVERDLPITLELLTLAESGIGFDAAVGRIIKSQPSERALPTDSARCRASFWRGDPRVDCSAWCGAAAGHYFGDDLHLRNRASGTDRFGRGGSIEATGQ